MSDNTAIQETMDTISKSLESVKTVTSETAARVRKETYSEILRGLVNLEVESAEMTEENCQKFAYYYALISEIREEIPKYRGMTEIPVETLETMARLRATPAEMRTLFMMVRYTEALKAFEKEKPKLARMLWGAHK